MNWIVAGCWWTFLAVWTVGAIYNFVRAPRVTKREFPINWVLGGVLYAVIRLIPPAGFVHWDVPWLQDVGCVLLLVATAFTLWARVVLGRMWSSEPVAREGHQLRTTGPYAITRHPIYTGILGMLLGTLLVAQGGGWLYGFLGAIAILLLKIRMEDRLMHEAFGPAFEAWRARTPALIPFTRLPGRLSSRR